MLTSRAEYRLVLRADNADRRLTERGLAIGCIGEARAKTWRAKAGALAEAEALVRSLAMTPPALQRHGIEVNGDGQLRSVRDLLGHGEIDLARLARIWPELAAIRPDVAEQITIDARYASYLERQEADIRAFRRDEALALPDELDYAAVGSLSTEARQKLEAARPATLGAAGRIPGVTPAALIALLKHVKRAAPAWSA
jgi:tRNA uridine 5-carboxymethylaminomethyl modification enzyme